MSGRKYGYGRGLLNHFTRLQRERATKAGTLRDAHGAVTLTGSITHFEGVARDLRYYEFGGDSNGNWHGRRIWLGGISAQRGY